MVDQPLRKTNCVNTFKEKNKQIKEDDKNANHSTTEKLSSHHKSARKKQQIYKGKKKMAVKQVEVHFQHIT